MKHLWARSTDESNRPMLVCLDCGYRWHPDQRKPQPCKLVAPNATPPRIVALLDQIDRLEGAAIALGGATKDNEALRAELAESRRREGEAVQLLREWHGYPGHRTLAPIPGCPACAFLAAIPVPPGGEE